MWHSTLNKTKGKKHIIVPIDAENIYQNFVWHNLTFHNKHHQQPRNKRPLLQHNIGHTWQGNVIVNSRNLKSFPLRLGTRQGYPLLLLLFNLVLEVLATELGEVRVEKEIQEIEIGKDVNLSVCRWHDTIHRKS